MEKGYPPQESAPPYPGPPLNYSGTAPPPGMYPQQPEMYPQQPGMYPQQPGTYPQQPGMYPQPGFSQAAPPPAAYQGGPQFAPPPAAHTTVTHILTPALHDVPGQTVCPHCRQAVVTKTDHTPGLATWVICIVLAVMGCFLCCFIPFCVDSCQDVRHSCPSCRRDIYIYQRWK